MFSALEPDIALETAVLRRRHPKTLLEEPPKRTTLYMLQSQRKLLNVCSHLSLAVVVRVCRIPGFTQKHQKVGRRTSVHDLRSPKLPSEERFMTMNSYVCKMWRCVQQRVSYVELLIPKLNFEAKTTVFTTFFYRSTDQPVFSVF